MAVYESFPGPSGVVDSLELRRDLAGLIARDASGVPRAGVFPRSTSALVTATASTGPMTVNVGPFEAALVREGGPLFIANDGTVAATIATAPVANSRIDVVYVRQNESAAPMSDPNNTPVIAVATGTAAASPVKPSIPAGALELATVTVPAGVTATNAVGVVISQTAPFTAASGGRILFRTQAEMLAFAAGPRQLGAVFADSASYKNGDYVFTSAWIAENAVGYSFSSSPVAGTAWDGVSPLRFKKGTHAEVTDSSSLIVEGWPGGAFPNGLLSLAVSPGDAGANAKQAINAASTVASLRVQMLSGTGASLAGAAQRVNYDAVGW